MKSLNQLYTDMQKIPAKAKIFLLQNLSLMIKTGIPLAEALQTIENQTTNKKLKKIIKEAHLQVEQGKTFSESLKPYQKDFGDMFINMIEAGEASGRLEEILKRLYKDTKREHEIKTKIRNALTYPTIIILAMIGIGTFVIFFVLPNITQVFDEIGTDLPIATRILIGISDIAQQNGLLAGTIALILLAIFVRIIRTKSGKKMLSYLSLNLPILSSIVKQINLARIGRSLSSLIKTDIAIADSIIITSKIVKNYYYKQALVESAVQVKKGEKLELIFKKYPKLFPPIITQMVAVGEETGALDDVLSQLANFYEEEVSQTMDTLPIIIEPLLMLLIGVAVAGIALAVLMPMYSLTQSI
ncbi:MAG TPA: type II secretion system F family protein [Patescibacteria group bacterium]|nr:type II secretion system F family protein [Patescibacteria group bacterium]